MVTQSQGKLVLSLCRACLLAVLAAAQAAERPAASSVDSQTAKLLTVRTVCVDELGGADGREQIRDMLIGSLQRSGLFILTEDSERADAYLRGSAEDLIFVDLYRQRDGIQVRGSASASERGSEESDYRSNSFGIGDTDESYRRERKHEAMAAVRLVLANGEVVWSTTQESSGAKYRGAAADVAEKVAKELAGAFERARRLAGPRTSETEGLEAKSAER